MKNLIKRKINLFGKEISVLVISLFAIALVSAGVLTHFGMFSFTATLNPTISVDGKTGYDSFNHEIPEIAPGGESFCWLHKIKNDASIPMDLELITTGEEAGITIGMYKVPETTDLDLCYKDYNEESPTAWKCLNDPEVSLIFNTVNPTFDYSLTASKLSAFTEYSIIYYPDLNSDKDWNAENIVVIDKFTTDSSGDYSGSNDIDLNMNLPDSADYNIYPSPNYCNEANGFDSYEHCRGGKIWIVLTKDITKGKLNKWNPSAWLFETDLITYSDCDLYTKDVVDFTVDRGALISVLKTQSHDMTPVLICYDFDKMAYGEFEVISTLMPL